MRVGIIGQGPFALEAAFQISELGGSVVLFAERALNSDIDFSIPVELQNNQVSFQEYYNNYLKQKIEKVQQSCDVYQFCEIKRVYKKFLNKGETFQKRSRLADLFRIVYTLDPTQNVLKQVEENPEIFNKLGEEVVSSLKQRVEMSEDVDIVIDGRERLFYPQFTGVDGNPIVNEQKWEKNIFNSCLSYDEIEQLTGKVIVISNDQKLSSYLETILLQRFEQLSKIYLLAEKSFFPQLMSEDQKKWERDLDRFHEKMNDWKALEDYEKVKVPRPAEPSRKVNSLSDMRAMSVDKLLDRDEFFITAEQFASDSEKLQTFGVDQILSFNSIQCELEDENEPGYFIVSDSFIDHALYNADNVESIVKKIIDRLLIYFSKA
jgi:galactitol-specific phosphotransferase system IIB component